MKLKQVTVQRYRSISRMVVNIGDAGPLIICGANNVGKTNLLRALDLFFGLDEKKFDKDRDIPYDIAEGRSTGGRYNTTIEAIFFDGNVRYKFKAIFGWKRNKGNYLKIKAKQGTTVLAESEAKKIIRDFRFLFIEASNVHIPKIIAEIIDEEVLPIGLDTLRKNQTEPLKKLNKFIKASKESVKGIEVAVEENVNKFITNVPGIDTEGWRVEILFAEFEKLREALSGLIDFTLYDRNKKKMESKGSGIQRIVLLSIMKYISDRSKRNIIWGIDEPEAFLQPALQKKTFDILRDLAIKQLVVFTTHSQHFVDIANVNNTLLLEADYQEKAYAKKKDEVFYKVNTFVDAECSEYEKVQKIKKHLGINRNDGWEVLPYNLLVEGDEDKQYITSLADKFGFETPNILVAGGANKIRGYLQYLLNFANDLGFKPRVKCILDNDSEGKKEYKSIQKSIADNKYKSLNLTVEYIPRVDGLKDDSFDNEMEDFIYPQIILDAANKFIKKIGYKKIKASALKDRYQAAYDKKNILSFLGEKTKASNPSQKAINFEDSAGGLKKIICQNACSYLKSENLLKVSSKYPEVELYIKKICTIK